jgi:hypothetical protein
MKYNDFIKFWNLEYPKILPISHELKWAYPERWFRIHGLPHSKRYAESNEEYITLLDRQNKLIDDLFGQQTQFFIYIKLYNIDNAEVQKKDLKAYGAFELVQSIDFSKIRAIFVYPSNKNIIAPYDGGVDIIVNNTDLKNIYKKKYANWLSTREDGM